jgi:GntR family transcriptional regulator / MocR family aminotransferase
LKNIVLNGVFIQESTVRNFTNTLATIQLERGANEPLHRQLYDGLREAILTGNLEPGTRLPATRTLADDLALSRNTVLTAFEQLSAEGYLESRVGDGTYIAHALPDAALHAEARVQQAAPLQARSRKLSRRGELLTATPVTVNRQRRDGAFRHGIGALEAFPYETWARLEARHWKNPPRELLAYSDPAGYAPLREVIAAHLRATRAVRCDASQVIVTTGSQQGLDLAARVLLDPGDAAWLEDPGYIGARGAFTASGAKVISVPVDREGLDVQAGLTLKPDAKLVYVTPSHQYPLGVTMSLGRRLQLLEWASQAGAWVLEDDYDSEYRYAGRPLASLQGLDRDARVIYLGTFSKVLMPGLRLGYVVAPPDLVSAFVSARALMDRNSAGVPQAVLKDFMLDGHFSRHIRRTRIMYAQRQEVLLQAARVHLNGLLEVKPAESGMHLIGWLPDGISDIDASSAAAKHDVEALPLSAYSERALEPQGLMLGYAAVKPEEINDGAKRLGKALRGLEKSAIKHRTRR